MLRASSYTVYVDLPGEDSTLLLFHGYTSACDQVSRSVASWVRSLEPKRPPKPLYGDWKPEPILAEVPEPPSSETIAYLTKRGYLTELSTQEELERFDRIVRLLHQGPRALLSYVFMPTYDCNLRCAYCFQDHMRTDPAYRHLLRRMSPSLIARIFAAIPELEAKARDGQMPVEHTRRFGFFGGEPFLAQNRTVITGLLEGARALGPASFWGVTNGTELDAYADLLGPDGIASLQITLDGPPETHDARRIYADGSGSFARIAENISLALERQVQVRVRLNLDKDNVERLPDLAELLSQQGWSTHPRFAAYAAPVTKYNEHTDGTKVFSSWALSQRMTQIRAQAPQTASIQRPDEALKTQVWRMFTRKSAAATPGQPETIDPLELLKPSFCGAHNGMVLFDALGDLYACWDRTGDARIRIGHLPEQGGVMLNPELLAQWRSRTVSTNPVCRQCRYALKCGGGCAVLAEASAGGFFSNHCDGYAQRFRSMVAEAWLAVQRGELLEPTALPLCDL